MFRLIRKEKGFTLVELMVVAVIVAILAAVTVPLLMANTDRARASEGAAALGTYRTSARVYYSENNTYTGFTGSDVDLTGNKYFLAGGTNPDLTGTGGTLLDVKLTGSGKANNLVMTIDEVGMIMWSRDSGVAWAIY